MSAAIVEDLVPEKEEPRRRKGRDRISTLLKPHFRMKVDALAKEEGRSQMDMIRTLIIEGLEARGYQSNVLLAEWHKEISESLLNGEKHPYGLDSR